MVQKIEKIDDLQVVLKEFTGYNDVNDAVKELLDDYLQAKERIRKQLITVMLVHLSFNFLKKPLNSGAIRRFFKSLKDKATSLKYYNLFPNRS